MGYSCLNFSKTGEVRPVGKVFTLKIIETMEVCQLHALVIKVAADKTRAKYHKSSIAMAESSYEAVNMIYLYTRRRSVH